MDPLIPILYANTINVAYIMYFAVETRAPTK